MKPENKCVRISYLSHRTTRGALLCYLQRRRHVQGELHIAKHLGALQTLTTRDGSDTLSKGNEEGFYKERNETEEGDEPMLLMSLTLSTLADLFVKTPLRPTVPRSLRKTNHATY